MSSPPLPWISLLIFAVVTSFHPFLSMSPWAGREALSFLAYHNLCVVSQHLSEPYISIILVPLILTVKSSAPGELSSGYSKLCLTVTTSSSSIKTVPPPPKSTLGLKCQYLFPVSLMVKIYLKPMFRPLPPWHMVRLLNSAKLALSLSQ